VLVGRITTRSQHRNLSQILPDNFDLTGRDNSRGVEIYGEDM